MEEKLPNMGQAQGSVVILRLRDRENVGSTLIRTIQRYAHELKLQGNKLMLAGISQHDYEQLERTDQLELIGENYVYLSRLKFTAAALSQAVADSQESISIQGNQSQATNIV